MQETTVNKLVKAHNLHFTTVKRCLTAANVPYRDIENGVFGTVRVYPLNLATESLKAAKPRIVHTAATRRTVVRECELEPVLIVAKRHNVHPTTVHKWVKGR